MAEKVTTTGKGEALTPPKDERSVKGAAVVLGFVA
jgi:hypothetical protein